jgi:prepilin-type N-terminal cleavage/methylation domain-containing protein
VIVSNQKGFALIEMVVAVAITGLLTVGTTTAVFQASTHITWGTNHMTAVKQVENALHWISRDAQMAQIVEPNGVSGFPLNLIRIPWDNTVHQVTYTLEDGELKRSYAANDGEPIKAVVAQYIDTNSEMTNCQSVNGALIFKVTAIAGEGSQVASETRVCKISPRPDL